MKELSAMPETTVNKFRFISDFVDELNHASDRKFSMVIFETPPVSVSQFE
jgi:hypothetical protein